MFDQKATCLRAEAGRECPRMRSICWKDNTVDASGSEVRKVVSLDQDRLVTPADRLQRGPIPAADRRQTIARPTALPHESRLTGMASGSPNAWTEHRSAFPRPPTERQISTSDQVAIHLGRIRP